MHACPLCPDTSLTRFLHWTGNRYVRCCLKCKHVLEIGNVTTREIILAKVTSHPDAPELLRRARALRPPRSAHRL